VSPRALRTILPKISWLYLWACGLDSRGTMRQEITHGYPSDHVGLQNCHQSHKLPIGLPRTPCSSRYGT
jgi:hypothetical protein